MITQNQKQELLDFINSLPVEEPAPAQLKTKISELGEKDVIHTETEAEYYRISILLHLAGKKWGSGQSYLEITKWSIYSELTCFCAYDGTYSHRMWFAMERYNIIPSTQITDI